jgi:DNA polymerase III alpha subunit (gram-positive type)
VSKRDYVVFDVETTGLDPNWNEIIELAAVKLDANTLEEKGRYYSKVQFKYPRRMSKKVAEMNHYNEDEWKDKARPPKDVIDGFLEFSADCIKVGHNVKFDMNFVEAAYKRYMKQVFTVSGPAPNPWGKGYHAIDTSSLAAPLQFKGELYSVSLKNVCKHLGITNNKAHAAMSDVLATAEVFRKLIRR